MGSPKSFTLLLLNMGSSPVFILLCNSRTILFMQVMHKFECGIAKVNSSGSRTLKQPVRGNWLFVGDVQAGAIPGEPRSASGEGGGMPTHHEAACCGEDAPRNSLDVLDPAVRRRKEK